MTALYENSFPKIEAKTADYQLEPEDHGTIFTNRGASGTVAFTLPSSLDINDGWRARFFVVADQSMRIAGAAGSLVTFNDTSADDVEFETSSEQVGGGAEVVFDGTQFLVFLMTEETQTVTVASA